MNKLLASIVALIIIIAACAGIWYYYYDDNNNAATGSGIGTPDMAFDNYIEGSYYIYEGKYTLDGVTVEIWDKETIQNTTTSEITSEDWTKMTIDGITYEDVDTETLYRSEMNTDFSKTGTQTLSTIDGEQTVAVWKTILPDEDGYYSCMYIGDNGIIYQYSMIDEDTQRESKVPLIEMYKNISESVNGTPSGAFEHYAKGQYFIYNATFSEGGMNVEIYEKYTVGDVVDSDVTMTITTKITMNGSIIVDDEETETVSENEFVSMYKFVENKTITTIDGTENIAIWESIESDNEDAGRIYIGDNNIIYAQSSVDGISGEETMIPLTVKG